MYELFDKILLSDGTVAHIVEVFGNHEAYDVETPGGNVRTVVAEEIERLAV